MAIGRSTDQGGPPTIRCETSSVAASDFDLQAELPVLRSRALGDEPDPLEIRSQVVAEGVRPAGAHLWVRELLPHRGLEIDPDVGEELEDRPCGLRRIRREELETSYGEVLDAVSGAGCRSFQARARGNRPGGPRRPRGFASRPNALSRHDPWSQLLREIVAFGHTSTLRDPGVEPGNRSGEKSSPLSADSGMPVAPKDQWPSPGRLGGPCCSADNKRLPLPASSGLGLALAPRSPPLPPSRRRVSRDDAMAARVSSAGPATVRGGSGPTPASRSSRTPRDITLLLRDHIRKKDGRIFQLLEEPVGAASKVANHA